MSKNLLLVMLVLVFTLTGCTTGVSQEAYDALLAENEHLKQQLAQYERISDTQSDNTPVLEQNTDISNPSPESDFIYVNNGSEVQINGYTGNGGQVVIPTQIEGSVVTRIAPNAFEEAENITAITLPEKLQYIGDNAFYGLKNLTGVLVIPETVTTIEGHAFQSTRLTGLVIKSSCEININAFANINSLDFIYVEEGCAPKIGTSAFCYAEALTVAVFPDTMVEINDETFKFCNSMVIYTTQGSFAEAYANRNFISVNTENYAEQVKNFSKVYETSNLDSNNTTPDIEQYTLSQYGITDTEALFYANVLDTINSLKQIHANPDTIEILGASVMNPASDNPRTIAYISYVGLDDNEYTDYFWKDMNEPEIKAKYAKDCYTGNNGRNPIEQLNLDELVYYEVCGAYTPNLSPESKIYLDK